MTAVSPDGGGYVTAWPCDQQMPVVSNLNFEQGQTVPNAATVKLAADGTVCLFTTAATHLLADVAGYYTGDPDIGLVVSTRRATASASMWRRGTYQRRSCCCAGPTGGQHGAMTACGGVGPVPSDVVLALDTSPLPRRRRLPTFLGIVLLTIVLGAAGMLIAARRVVDDVPRVAGVSSVLSGDSANVENYLLVGSDSRALGDPNTGETGDVTGNRSDTIMVLRIDKGNGSASLLSIPRDLWVDRSGHDSKGRINSSFNDGAAALVQTVQGGELRIPIHHYVEIDFSGFKALVDALGGVQVCFWYPTRDFNTGLDIQVGGCYILDGTQGLAYARSRYYEEFRDGEWREDPTSDLGRSTRQRAFVNASLQAALAQVKANPFNTGELVSKIAASIRIDDELDPIGAGASLRTAVGDGLLTYSVPVVGKTIEGNAVLLLGDGAESVLAYFRGDGPAPAPAN